MSEYTLQECAITVPDVFRDRTMNLFTLSNAGASEFTFVISRATARADDTLQSVSSRLAKELDTNMQALTLFHGQLTELAGTQALELFYSFRTGERTLFQKQRIVLVPDKPQGRKLLCFIGTCPDAFDDYHARVYDDITASIRFHDATMTPAANNTQIPPDSPTLFFTFDRESRELAVFSGVSTLYASIDLTRAKNGEYLFFDAAGAQLTIAPVDTGGTSARYALWESANSPKSGLIHSLLLAKNIRGIPGLDSIDAIEAYISQQWNQS
ncbi:DcrB-related protein [Serratia marcescens]|nr:DcrB-related protein [Serratia marcescens]